MQRKFSLTRKLFSEQSMFLSKLHYSMKNGLLALVIVFIYTASSGQERFAVSVTAVTPKFNATNYDLGKSISYAVSGHVEGKISAPIGYEAYVQFADYRFDKSALKSIDIGFMFKFYATPKLYFAPGFQVGKVVRVSYDRHEVADADKVALPCYTLGTGYELTDHFAITARFNGSLEDSIDFTTNVGVKYRF